MNLSPAKATSLPNWSLAFLTLLVVGIAFVYQIIWLDIWNYSFDDGTYSHAYLIPFVCLYVIYVGFKEHRFNLQPSNNYIAIIASFALAALILLSYVAQFPLLARALLPLLIFCLLWIVLRFSLELALVCVLLWFVTPIWGPLVAPLQGMSVAAVDFIMSFVSIASFIEGNMVTIAVGQFEIAGGCSGLRYFITSCFVAVMYVYLNIRKPKNIFIFLVLCLGGALVTNWIRIVVIIMIGHYTDMQSPIIEDHNNLGWFIYIPYLALLMWGGRSLADYHPSDNTATPPQNNDTKPSQLGLGLVCISIVLTASPATFDWLTTGEIKSPALTQLEGHSYLLTKVHSSKSSQLNTPSGSATWIEASFTGPGFDSKASFFEHQLPKSGIRGKAKVLANNIHVYTFRQGYQNWLMAYQFDIDGQHPKTRSQLVKQQFKQAAQGRRGSKIRLLEIACSEDCESFSSQIQTYFPE